MVEGVNGSVSAAVRADRAVGAVVVSACGDALGAGYEFRRIPTAGEPVEMIGGGLGAWAPGEWTDDTQMASAVLAPLADGDTDPVPAVEANFRAWFATDPPDVGSQTRRVLRSSGSLAEKAAEIVRANPDASGNGSLMRTGPVALARPDAPEAIAVLAQEVSALTHASEDCTDACVLWSIAIDHAIHHAPMSDQTYDWSAGLLSGLAWIPVERQDLWRARITEAIEGAPEAWNPNGYVVDAFQAALSAISATPVDPGDVPCTQLQRALDRAVRIGDDTDTVAAIAGSLLGARWGATAVPMAWRRLVHGTTFDGSVLRLADLERQARLAFWRGEPDSTGWPKEESMRAYYEAEWPAPPLRVVLGDVEFGNVHAVPDAIEDKIDVVVSLCRMGTADVPAGIEHHVLGLLDSTAADNPNAVFVLADLCEALAAWLDAGKRVFVHCVQAENRTPAVALTWLEGRGMSPEDARRQVEGTLGWPHPFLVTAAEQAATVCSGR